MASMLEHHYTLTNGSGRCSVPKWYEGVPYGFCDKPAYGGRVNKARYDGYVPGLACYEHGGPMNKPRRQPGH